MNKPDIYREWAPPAGWGHAVACCWEQRVSSERVQRVLPDAHADLLIYDSGLIEIVGLYDEVALPVLPAGARLRGIRFRPAAVAAAFRTPASCLRNRSVPADAVLGSRRARRLADRETIDAWVHSIEPSRVASAAVDLLATRSVDEAAAALGVTGRHLRRIVLAEVGLAPKVYQQVVRLQRFVRAVDAGAPLAAAAAAAGYADQPHLTRDIRRFAGLTPALLAQERRSA
ncbi:MAG: helix-turn-helix domain-containing protein [Acidimicrobiales bacterium]